ncbi:MAG: hypothetical protein HQL49_12490 [Gammaproteobacteria bacterium]|nr:hypothetical protein [Gammaproteobacteria bacterium]
MKGHKGSILALLCCGLLASGSLFADKPSWSGGDHGDNDESNRGKSERNNSNKNKHNSSDERGDDNGRRDDRHKRDKSYSSRYFDADRRNRIHDYYVLRRDSGRCPPGMARRDYGCVLLSYERRWAVGQRIPRDVIFYDVEPEVLINLGPPPAKHRFVRVASDILLIAVGTGLVVDAIDDLGSD